jgi:UDP-N-acetylglucosamine acyltransferase
MATRIHSTAIISDDNVSIGEDVVIGPYAIVEENVVIGDGVTLKAHTHVGARTQIGKNCRVFQGAVIGEVSQDMKYADEETETIIGDNTTIREYCTVHRGTADRWKTEVGSNVLLLAYSHVAHDCVIGDNVIISNACQIGGHVEIGDYVILGGAVPVHQFCRIGAHSMVGGGFRVTKDVPPYIRAAKAPLAYNGLNSIGLHRRGFSHETINTIKRVYTMIYRSKLNVSHAIRYVKENMDMTPEVRKVIAFVESSQRGIIRG